MFLGFSVRAAFIGWLVYFSYSFYVAETHMSVVKQALTANPVLALMENSEAYSVFPYPAEIRRQLSGAFLSVINRNAAKVLPEAGDRMWEIGRTVGEWDVSVLTSRAGYLVNYDPSGLPPIADRLVEVAPWSTETWVIEAYRRIVSGEAGKALEALEKAKGTGRLEPVIESALMASIRRLQ